MSSAGLYDARDPACLIDEYVALCNRVLAENEHRFLFRQARWANGAIWGKPRFRTIVYERDPGQPLGEYILQFDPDAPVEPGSRPLSIVAPSEAATHGVAFSWKVPVRCLEDVVKVRPE
jgi:hypothetical protein